MCKILPRPLLTTPGGIQRHSKGGSNTPILADEQVDALAGSEPAIRDFMFCCGKRDFIKCESGKFRLLTPRGHGSARMYLGTEYISLTQPDMVYLVRVFHVRNNKAAEL